jgi:hypothetical protein
MWAAFLVSGARPLAWTAVALIMAAVGLGVCTVTLWTPYPARTAGQRRPAGHGEVPAAVRPDAGTAAAPAAPAAPAAAAPGAEGSGDPAAFHVTDEMIAGLLDDSYRAPRHRPIRPDPAVLVPVAHGFAAIATFALAVMAAIE